MKPTSYRHALLPFALLALGLATAFGVRAALVPDTFGDRGWYRAAAVDDQAALAASYAPPTACAECHDDKAALHAKDAHERVPCQTCHGPGAEHVATNEVKLPKPAAASDCLACHQRLLARPGPFPQIDRRDHFKLVGVKDESTPCTTCHDPHEPLFLDRDRRQARLHPLIQRCRDCHLGRTDETLVKPADHPAIFECQYCHGEIVADFKQRPHQRVPCTTCHLFTKESDFAGRIVRDADPRFCLLCHRAGAFRSVDAPPSIEWPSHRDDVSTGPQDANKRCVDCHQDRIHLRRADLGAAHGG